MGIGRYIDIYMDMGIGTRIDMWMDMGIAMCIDMARTVISCWESSASGQRQGAVTNVHIDPYADLCADMCIEMCTVTRIDGRGQCFIQVSVSVCTDMRRRGYAHV